MKSSVKLKKIYREPILPFEKFHAISSRRPPTQKEIPFDEWPTEWKEIQYKGYPRLKSICLPRKKLPAYSLEMTLMNRYSERAFSRKRIPLQKLGSLFLYSAGIKPNSKSRYYPSAGARYPLELYFISTNTDLPNGIYHYYVLSHCLEVIMTFDSFDYDTYVTQPWIRSAGGLLIITSSFKRTTNKYGDRGYRYVVSESGHLGQNIYLVSTALNLACCGIGGFDDKKMDKLLDIDSVDESSLSCFAIGNKV